MASAIICLATDKIFNFSKYVFDNLVKHLDGGVKFLMYPRFVQVFLDNQVEVYTSCIEQFWASSKVKNVNREAQIQALLDKKKVVITEASIRKDLSEKVEQSVKVVEKEVSTADPVTTAGEVVTTVAKLKAITTAATTVTSVGTRPKEKGIVMQEPSKTTLPKPIISSQKPSQAKDKGKRKMVDPERPLKRKYQIMMDAKVTKNLEAQMKAELEEEERLARQKEEQTNITLVAEWDNTQAMVDANLDKLEQEDAKRQRIEAENETEKLKRCLEIIHKDDDDVTIKATPISPKSPTIVDYKIYKEGKKSFFKIIKADVNSQNYLTFGKMFKNFNREDLEVLWSIVKARFKKKKPIDDMDNLLFETLKTMFEHHIEDNI
nr:ribonuclease H-like domain, reverse transcriptase, RNA-dependent DNA polymerase [Tanacetum cinerariifolium]